MVISVSPQSANRPRSGSAVSSVFPLVGFKGLAHPKRLDLVAFPLQDLEAVTMIGKGLTRRRDGLAFMDDKTGDRDGFIIRQLPVHGPVQIADRDIATHDGAAFFHALYPSQLFIILILNIANYFFQYVFQCDDAHQRAILIDNQREMFAFALKGAQLFDDRCGLRDEPGLAQKLLDIDRSRVDCLGQSGQQILDVNDANHIV